MSARAYPLTTGRFAPNHRGLIAGSPRPVGNEPGTAAPVPSPRTLYANQRRRRTRVAMGSA